jgi:hypothetical protein
VNVFLAPDVAHNPVRTRLVCNLLDRPGVAGNKRNTSAAGNEAPNEGEPEAGRPPGNSYAKLSKIVIGRH